AKAQGNPGKSSFLNLLRPPDYACAYESLNQPIPLTFSKRAWKGRDVTVTIEPQRADDTEELPIHLSAPESEVTRLHVRWQATVAPDILALGDAWERSYGDLEWRALMPERVMPWYFLTYDGAAVHGYGVKTATKALCFWQLDAQGVSLWLDVSNGGSGVSLGERQLAAATVVTRQGRAGADPMEEARAFCKRMCNAPRLSPDPIYGTNDWYYAYGKNTAAQLLRDAEMLSSLSAGNRVRPFAVIDMGWENNPTAFPDMERLAQDMKKLQVRPGIWIRPLLAPESAKANLLLPGARFGKRRERVKELAYDPTIPEALEIVKGKVKQVVDWTYELVKHDFSTYDLLGQWGREMGAQPTLPGWSLHDRTRTNAEVIHDLYESLRSVARQQTIIGCNTVGHLAAGLFEAQRTGDDTSGKIWERTRRMGVNTLAYRLPQHNTFFAVDPDCVGITKDIPWELNRQWLDLLARSGAALFVSSAPDATGAEQREALRQAFALAASGKAEGRPTDWFHDTTPRRWQFGNPTAAERYDWMPPLGAWPFEI
ncbi:MAG TPA: hypothetical protein VGE93_06995, partial [Bryobacteraceae bacterium]